MATQVFSPIELFHDVNGQPLDDGFIWIGQPNLDPQTNPISVFFDDALTVPATQPIRTRNGYPSNAGDQARLYVTATTYSIRVKNKNGSQITSITAIDSLRKDLAAPSGGDLSGFSRKVLTDGIATVREALSGQFIHLREFASLITSKPNPSDQTTWDWTPAVQGLIDACANTYGRYTGLLPAGIFPITRIVRRRGVKLIGMGSRSTAFVALPFVPGGPNPYGMVEIEGGAVAGSGMTGVAFYGSAAATYGNAAVNANQWGFYCHAQYDPTFTQGGFWHSQDIDVAYWNFNFGLWSRGGYTDANSARPNQFIDFINVQIGVQSGGTAWRFTGQHGQINVMNGYGEGLNPAGFAIAAKAVEITWDPDPSTTAINGVNGESTADVPGVGNAARAPTNIALGKGFALQKSRKSLHIKGAARNIEVDSCWFEFVGQSVTLENSASVSIRGTRFANAANGTIGGAAGTGWIVDQQAGTYLDWSQGNHVSGTMDAFIPSTSASNNNLDGYTFTAPLAITTTSATVLPARGVKQQTISGAGAIDVAAHPLCLVVNNADRTIRLERIDGKQMPGMRIILRASGGSFTLRSTGNIVTGMPKDITVASGGCAVLERLMPSTNGLDWVLVSTTEHFATAVPADGFYYSLGHKTWNSTPAPGGIPGWICTTAGLAGTTAVFRNMAALA